MGSESTGKVQADKKFQKRWNKWVDEMPPLLKYTQSHPYNWYQNMDELKDWLKRMPRQ